MGRWGMLWDFENPQLLKLFFLEFLEFNKMQEKINFKIPFKVLQENLFTFVISGLASVQCNLTERDQPYKLLSACRRTEQEHGHDGFKSFWQTGLQVRRETTDGKKDKEEVKDCFSPGFTSHFGDVGTPLPVLLSLKNPRASFSSNRATGKSV